MIIFWSINRNKSIINFVIIGHMPLQYKDLVPSIFRQRLVIEGFPKKAISDKQICNYLSELSKIIDMTELMSPVTHKSNRFGWAGWIHWETSGAHFYAWEKPTLFFSVDIYTCKPFSSEIAVAFTKKFFDASEVVAKDF